VSDRSDQGGRSGLPPWRARLLGWLWSVILRLQAASWRKTVRGLDRFDARLAEGRPVFALFWHGKYTPLFALLRGRKAVIFTSLSARGDVIATICRHFGYTPVQLADHGGDDSLERMRGALRGAPACGIAVDGPLGPYHAVKRGPIQLASELGFLVFPVTFAARRSRIDVDRWDRFELPSPFTRVVLLVGEEIEVPPGVGEEHPEELHRWTERLHRALDALDREAEEESARSCRADS